MSDPMEKIRAQWAQEKAGGYWSEAYLQEERKKRRAWIEKQVIEREQEERKQFKHATGPEVTK